MRKKQKITLITGANRGMGFEMAKEIGATGQLILVGARNLEKGQDAIKALRELDIKAELVQLDITNSNSIAQAIEQIQRNYGYLDILINNAGIALDHFQSPSKLSVTTIRQDFEVNFFGLIELTQALLPLLKASGNAKIINISSEMGSLYSATTPTSALYNATAVGYQASKAALNMFTVKLAHELKDLKDATITVNAIDPGMVATEFGGVTPEQAKVMGAKPVNEGIARALELALDPENNITATFSNSDGMVNW
ncbi:carbonyl reductase [Niallia circulans]|uniref:SDR family oxidoreductase n=1 Tax=Niallia circulans TaxID=1397 RepID=UPI000BA57BA7|nr:SDR family oxidoreductase [Niallia circulans]PAD88188.1 carbonyl reductase [Niallia circulans]